MRGGGYTIWGGSDTPSIHVEDLDTVCENLKILFDNQEAKIERYKLQVAALSDEKWRDKTLQELQEKIKVLEAKANSGFSIPSDMRSAIQDWKENHLRKIHHKGTLEERLQFGGAIGGTFNYVFTPTSIGDIGVCQCSACLHNAYRLIEQGELSASNVSDYMKDNDAEFVFEDLI